MEQSKGIEFGMFEVYLMHFINYMTYECVKTPSEYHRNGVYCVKQACDFMCWTTDMLMLIHKSFQFNNLEINHRAHFLSFRYFHFISIPQQAPVSHSICVII